MKNSVCVSWVLAVLFVACGPLWGADVVFRRSTTTKASGEVTTITKSEVTVKPKSGDAVVVPANDVVHIEWDKESGTSKAARADEAGGRLQKALDTFEKITSDGKGSDGYKTDISFFIARTTAKMAEADPEKLGDAIKHLEQFKSKHKDSYHYYDCVELLGQLYMTKKDVAKAKDAYDILEKSSFNDYRMTAKIAVARQDLTDQKIPDALKAFEAVSQMETKTPRETSKKQEAKLGVAHCLQLQKEFDKAIKLLEEVIQESDPEDAHVQAEAYIRQGDCLQAAGKAKEAMIAYLHVDVLFPTEKQLHAESLYHLSKLWATVQQPERAADAADRLASEYPNSAWTLKLKAPTATE